MSDRTLSTDEIEAAELSDWRPIVRAIHARFATGDFATGLRLVNLIGDAAEAADHHPDVTLRYTHVEVTLFSHDSSGVTERDISLARRISELASSLGVGSEPDQVAALEIALDTPDPDRIKPFWRAVLGYSDNPRDEDEVCDAAGALPTLWFQKSGRDEPRQRFHLDLRLPADVVADRIDKAVEAGGTVVGGEPDFTVLQDADGNKVCLCRY